MFLWLWWERKWGARCWCWGGNQSHGKESRGVSRLELRAEVLFSLAIYQLLQSHLVEFGMVVPKICGMGSWNWGRKLWRAAWTWCGERNHPPRRPLRSRTGAKQALKLTLTLQPEHEGGFGSGSPRQNNSIDSNRERAGCFPKLHLPRGCSALRVPLFVMELWWCLFSEHPDSVHPMECWGESACHFMAVISWLSFHVQFVRHKRCQATNWRQFPHFTTRREGAPGDSLSRSRGIAAPHFPLCCWSYFSLPSFPSALCSWLSSQSAFCHPGKSMNLTRKPHEL